MDVNKIIKKALGQGSNRKMCLNNRLTLDRTLFIEYETHKDTLVGFTNMVFPKEYSPVQHNISVQFMKFIIKNEIITGNDLRKFLGVNGFAKSTLYNKVIPKLERFKMIKIVRDIKQSRIRTIEIDRMFGEHIRHIGQSWLEHVNKWELKEEMIE